MRNWMKINEVLNRVYRKNKIASTIYGLIIAITNTSTLIVI